MLAASKSSRSGIFDVYRLREVCDDLETIFLRLIYDRQKYILVKAAVGLTGYTRAGWG